MSFKGMFLIALVITAILSIYPPLERFLWALGCMTVLTFLLAVQADIEVNKLKRQIDELKGRR